jgi:apolipoprotein N-acyltransferase
MKNSRRIPFLLVCLGIAAWMGIEMSTRTANELLWGYRPLVLFLSVWGAITFLLLPRWGKSAQEMRWLTLSTFSGLFLGIGFPGIIPMPLIMFAAFVPLLIVEQEIHHTYEPAKRKLLMRYAFHTFMIWNIIATYWVTNTALIAGFVAITANALLMTIPFLMFHTSRKIMPKTAYLSLIAFWLTFEYAHLHWEISWSWLNLGNSFAQYPSWVQWYEYTGMFGGSLWIWGLNILSLMLWNRYQQNRSLRNAIIRILAVVVLPIGWSLVMYYNYQEKGEAKQVVVVQPNFEPHYQKFNIPEQEQITRFLELTESAVDEEVDYVVFPETSFGLVRIDNISSMNGYRTIKRIREVLADYPGLNVISGVNAYYAFKEGEEHSKAVRVQQRKNGPFYYEISNAAIQITIGEEDIPVYKKSKLVPGPEIFPYSEWLFFLEPLIERLDGTTAGLATQKERSVLSSDRGSIAPVICYESVFGEYVTEYIRKGGQVIFIMTNDGWWDNTAGHRQHLHFARLRAIETRKSIARSANTGISAFINQRGDIQQPTRYDEAAAIRQEVLFNEQITFYTQWGDLIARAALFTAILLLLNSFVRKRVNKTPD